MSCETNANKTASAGIAAGLTRLAAKSAYARTMRRNIAFTRRALTAIRNFLAGAAPSEPATVRELSAKPTASPVTPPTGQTCAECGRTADRGGAWYRLDGKYYCTDCAPAAAQKSGVSLTVSAPQTSVRLTAQHAVTGTNYRPPGNIQIKEQPVDVVVGGTDGRQRLVHLDRAYTVLRNNAPTGMAITPSWENDRPSATKWALTHIDSGRAFADGFHDIHEAEGLATLLSRFDWRRPFEAMPQATLKEAGEIIGRYEAQLTALRGTLANSAWRNRNLTGKLVNDGLGDIAYVVEDNGEKLLLAGAEGQYMMPRNVVHAPSKADFKSLKLAMPAEPDTLPAGTVCARCKQPAAQTLDEQWFIVYDNIYCETCAPDAAKSADLAMPDQYITDVLLQSRKEN